jgi:hypothetical protein
MKPRKSKRPGYTPSFPALRDELIAPVSVKGEAPPATGFPGSFLSGFACAVNERPDAGSEEWQKLYDAYLASPRWKEKRGPIIDRANGHCERCGRACAVLEVHHLTYDRRGPLEAIHEPQKRGLIASWTARDEEGRERRIHGASRSVAESDQTPYLA